MKSSPACLASKDKWQGKVLQSEINEREEEAAAPL